MSHTRVMYCILCFLGAVAGAVPGPRSFPAGELKGIAVHSSGGGIKVRGVQTTKVSVNPTRTLGGDTCSLAAKVEAGILQIAVADAGQKPCQIDLDIPLPRHLAVKIQSEAGNIFVSGTQGSLDISLEQGSAVLGGKTPHLTAHLGSGSLSAQGLTGDADVTIKSGNAQLWFVGASPATVTLEVERGNVTVGNDAASVDAQLNLEAGQLKSTLPQSADAPLHLKGHIAHGNVIVRGGR